jgi:nucleotide-binding universal stress UspA family protein
MFSRIVIATDLSEASDQIVINLNGLTPLGVEEVILVHAMDIAPQSISGPGCDYNETLRGDLSRRIQARLSKLRDVVEEQGFRASTRIVYGAPAAAVEALAQQVNASLVIVGSRGASLAKKIDLGNSALEILNHSHVPVLLKRLVKNEPSHESQYRLLCRDFSEHLLYATDFSAAADGAFHFLEQIVGSCRSAVTLLHVGESSPPPADQTAPARLAEMKAVLERAGAREVSVIQAVGSAAHEIARAVEADEVTLVVLGSHGNRTFQHSLLGSTSQEVARKGRVPVLIIPPAGTFSTTASRNSGSIPSRNHPGRGARSA